MSKDDNDNAVKTDPNAWMATLSDLVFLLITFFVLLITMSSLDSKKVKEAFGFFDDAAAVLNFPKQTQGSDRFVQVFAPITAFLEEPQDEEDYDDLPAAQKSTREFFGAMAASLSGAMHNKKRMLHTLKAMARQTGGEVKIERISDGYSITLPGRLLFPDGTTEIDEEGYALLGDIATILKLWGGRIDVVASWSWHGGPRVLGQIVTALERNWVNGELITPKLYPVAKRKVRFVLRKEKE
ncbi:MAG: flagellar motor protein MotB [Myxococcota bacterium]|nr:flagellar motor protein MotB [Myxococcota bacterium]